MTNSNPPKKQPVILVARPAAGGIRSHLIALLTHLDRSNFSLTLAAPKSLINSLPGNLPESAPVLLAIASKPSPLDFLAALQLTRIVRETPNAIVHAHGVRAGIVCSIARLICGFPLIVTHHNIPPKGLVSQSVLEMIDFGCASTVAVSNAIADCLPSTDTTVIPNGIDLADYGTLSRADAKTKLGLRSEDFIAAFLGRLSCEKGPDLIIRTALLRPEFQFLIGGDGPEMPRLIRNCPPNVLLLGRVSDPAVLLSAADVMLIPSRSEGQGIVALEAMASGTPVIASRVGGLIETLQQSQAGILVDPDAPTEIADALDKLKADPTLRQTLADAGKSWVTKNGRIGDKIKEIERLYLSLASDKMNL
jgi:glycosyltransferase involved in cell wall biosynthesis